MGLMLWLLQRITALCMGLYASVIIFYFSNNPWSYLSFREFFSTPLFSSLFLLTLFAISLHAMIGVWTIATDYMKCRSIRYATLSLYSALLFVTFFDAVLFIARLS